MNTFGERLKQERLRLGLSQENLASVGGVQRGAQIKYEKNERLPDAGYVSSIANIGIDVQYLLTGRKKTVLEELGEQGYLPGQAIQNAPGYSTAQAEPQRTTITSDEIELLQRYQRASFEVKAQIMQLLSGIEIKSSPKSSQTFHGEVLGGEFAGGNIINHGRTRKK